VCHFPCPYNYKSFDHLNINYCGDWGTWWRCWLGHCDTGRKMAGHWNFSLTHSFRLHHGPEDESASNRIFPEELRRPVRVSDNLTTSMCLLSWNLGASTFWKPQGLSRPALPFYCEDTVKFGDSLNNKQLKNYSYFEKSVCALKSLLERIINLSKKTGSSFEVLVT
jgi:hypothetical protein